jgi:hypothetical protein
MPRLRSHKPLRLSSRLDDFLSCVLGEGGAFLVTVVSMMLAVGCRAYAIWKTILILTACTINLEVILLSTENSGGTAVSGQVAEATAANEALTRAQQLAHSQLAAAEGQVR